MGNSSFPLLGGTKIRLHTTKRDVRLGCAAKPPEVSCPIARAVARMFPGQEYEVRTACFRVFSKNGTIAQWFYAVNEQRMATYTSLNDGGQMQKPASFTFVVIDEPVRNYYTH